jgi:hypothetical protein
MYYFSFCNNGNYVLQVGPALSIKMFDCLENEKKIFV